MGLPLGSCLHALFIQVQQIEYMKSLPTNVDIFAKLCRYIATRFLDVVHDVRFIHHIPLTERDELFELIG